MVSATSWGLPVNLSPTWSLLCYATSARSPRPATSFSRPRNPPTRAISNVAGCGRVGDADHRTVHRQVADDAILDAVTIQKDTGQQDGNSAEIPPFGFLWNSPCRDLYGIAVLRKSVRWDEKEPCAYPSKGTLQPAFPRCTRQLPHDLKNHGWRRMRSCSGCVSLPRVCLRSAVGEITHRYSRLVACIS